MTMKLRAGSGLSGLILVACALLILAALVGSAASGGNITVKGSDTMVILSQRWAENYMMEYPDVTIQVTGGGSGTGIAALLNGTTDLANSSRPMKAKEIENARKKGVELVEFKVAMDGVAVVVNKANPVSQLTMKQIMGIYIGYYKSWKDVGGPDKRIMRYCRESNSGTYVFFKEHVLKKRDYAADCQTMPGTGAVAEAVARDRWGIGYGGVAYFATRPELKIVSVSRDEDSPAVSPVKEDGTVNFEAVWDESYPLARYLYIYSAGTPRPDIKAFLDWILGPAGQDIVRLIGYIPLPVKGEG